MAHILVKCWAWRFPYVMTEMDGFQSISYWYFGIMIFYDDVMRRDDREYTRWDRLYGWVNKVQKPAPTPPGSLTKAFC